ncbi:MAG: amino acid permease [Gemmatimonadales bacterium]|nr:amino acid permease [Gemmatimonadales bacterium]
MTTATATVAGSDERLPRTLGLWSAVAILVGITIGSGIFRVPARIAESLGSPSAYLMVWVVGGVITLTGALAIAELAAMYPRSGGILPYLHEAWGPFPAFVSGWAELTVIRASAAGGIATIFAEYLGRFITLTPMGTRYVAAGLIVSVALLNWLGVNYAAKMMNVTTILKYGALIGIVLFAFGTGTGQAANFTTTEAMTAVGMSAFLTALIPVMWTYDGWANLAAIGGEVKDPGRNMPRGLLLGTAAIVVIYLLINMAYLYLVPIGEMPGVPLVAAAAAERIPLFGAAGAALISGIVMLSCFGATHGSVMTGPRIWFAMADRGLFFKGLARISPRFQTPSVAIWAVAAVSVIYVLQNDFGALADKFVIGSWPFYALAVAGVYRLRKTRPDVARPYRTWGYPVTPAIFLLASIGLMLNAVVTDRSGTLVTFAVIGSGIPAYFAFMAWQKRR